MPEYLPFNHSKEKKPTRNETADKIRELLDYQGQLFKAQNNSNNKQKPYIDEQINIVSELVGELLNDMINNNIK